MDIPLEDAHRPQLAAQQHVLQWLQAERARLESELQHVLQQGQRAQTELAGALERFYGVTPGSQWALDTERGVITVPDRVPDPVSAPVAAVSAPEQIIEAEVAPEPEG